MTKNKIDARLEQCKAEGRKALKTAPKYDTKTAIRPFPLLRQKWTVFHNRRHYAKNEPKTEE